MSAAIGEGFLFVNAHMFVVADIDQAIISWPAIGAQDALWIDPAPDDGSQGLLGAVSDDFGINFALALEDTEDTLFAGSSTAYRNSTNRPFVGHSPWHSLPSVLSAPATT